MNNQPKSLSLKPLKRGKTQCSLEKLRYLKEKSRKLKKKNKKERQRERKREGKKTPWANFTPYHTINH